MKTLFVVAALALSCLSLSPTKAAGAKEPELYPVDQVTCLAKGGRCRLDSQCCSGSCMTVGDIYGRCL